MSLSSPPEARYLPLWDHLTQFTHAKMIKKLKSNISQMKEIPQLCLKEIPYHKICCTLKIHSESNTCRKNMYVATNYQDGCPLCIAFLECFRPSHLLRILPDPCSTRRLYQSFHLYCIQVIKKFTCEIKISYCFAKISEFRSV